MIQKGTFYPESPFFQLAILKNLAYFSSGTAAVISPVGHLKWDDKVMEINKVILLEERLFC